ncbi:MAG: hypothetical protein IKX89_02085 [Firmicutes bacterium]|nr:hypothetical protein [Bacillota bacterium]
MKKLALIITMLLLCAAPAHAAGMHIEAVIPVENYGAPGVFELVKDGTVIDRISLDVGETGRFVLSFDTLDCFDYTIRQADLGLDERIEYDSAEYRIRITTVLSEGDVPTAFYSAEKTGEGGKAEKISYFNYVLLAESDEAPQTGDEAHPWHYALLSAAALCCALTVIRRSKKGAA